VQPAYHNCVVNTEDRGSEHLWMNGLYESLTIIFIFPLIVYLGASGEVKGKYALHLSKFLGGISYPVYITHYPIMYIYTTWVYDHKLSLQQAFPISPLTLVASIALAYACLKFYDEPVRRWLQEKILVKEK
jgi:peptidoglycan/LPS O-acetylase OafA/YrhL